MAFFYNYLIAPYELNNINFYLDIKVTKDQEQTMLLPALINFEKYQDAG
jgi:hypothetical protein